MGKGSGDGDLWVAASLSAQAESFLFKVHSSLLQVRGPRVLPVIPPEDQPLPKSGTEWRREQTNGLLSSEAQCLHGCEVMLLLCLYEHRPSLTVERSPSSSTETAGGGTCLSYEGEQQTSCSCLQQRPLPTVHSFQREEVNVAGWMLGEGAGERFMVQKHPKEQAIWSF